MVFLEVRWILRDTEPPGKVGRVLTTDILTVNGNVVDWADMIPAAGDIITVKEQPETVAGGVVLRRSTVPVGKRPLSAVAAQTAESGVAKKRKCKCILNYITWRFLCDLEDQLIGCITVWNLEQSWV